MMREFQVLRELQHKNIVKLQDAYETPSSLILVCELATGGTAAPRTATHAARATSAARATRAARVAFAAFYFTAPPFASPGCPAELRVLRLLFHRATFCLTGLPRRAPGPLDRRTDAPDRGGA